MKKFVLLAVTLSLFLIWPVSAVTQSSLEISQQRAFQEVSKLFEGKDVDYYSITPSGGSSTSEWLFFVDAMPDALWSHPCYVVSYPKNISTSEIAPAPQSQELSFPPEEYDYQPYQVKDRHEDEPMEAVGEPEYFSLSRSGNNSSADRTYALIVGGSPSKEKGEWFYVFFPECKFFYNTLLKRYNVPKDNIISLLYQPKNFNKNDKSNYIRNPDYLDFDGDGEYDIKKPATRNNIEESLNYLSTILKKNDNLIIHISSHGGNISTSESCLYICESEYMYANDLLNWISPILDNKVNVTVVLGACYSKKFADKLQKSGCVAIASSEGIALSNGTISYFFRYWLGALNHVDYYNKRVNADDNNDGYVSFYEAFNYMKSQLDKGFTGVVDGVQCDNYMHNPYFQSTPEHLIEQLAIDRVPADINIQPYSDSYDEEKGIYWNSPDIWLRRENDNKTDYQNVLSSNNTWIKVRVRNNGDMSSGEGKILRLYWAQASTVVSSGMWKGNYLFKDEEPVGGHIADISLDNINPNANKIYSVNWSVPRELIQTGTRPASHQFSIYAALVEDTGADTDPVFEIGKFTNTAMSTFSAIEKTDTLRTSTMFFYNPLSEQKGYKLKINWRDDYSKDLFRYANVVVDMSPTVYRSWERGGKAAIAVVDNGYSPYAAQLLEPTSYMSDIRMVGNGMGRISFIFDFFDAPSQVRDYHFDIVQTDENDNIVGGQTISLTPPIKSLDAFPVDSLEWGGGIGTINPNPDFGFLGKIRWYNSKNRKVSDSSTLRLTAEMCDDTYRAVAISSEGELSASEINVSLKFGIKNISFEETLSDGIRIEMYDDVPVAGYVLTLTSLTTGHTVYSRELLPDERIIDISTFDMPSGIYVLTCTLDGEIVNTYKFTK